MRSETFEVLSQGEISGPLNFPGIQRAVYTGRFSLEDSYRRIGSTKWKSIRAALRRNRLFGTILFGAYAIGGCLFGLWLFWHGLQFICLERESSSWPSVEGRITYAEVDNSMGGRFECRPKLGYVYQVGSKRRFGETIYPECVIGGTARWAQSVIDRHPAESSCRVYYSPKSPVRTMLEPGLKPHSFMLAGAGLMMAYVGVLLGCLAWSIWRRPVDKSPAKASILRSLFFIATVIMGFLFVRWLP